MIHGGFVDEIALVGGFVDEVALTMGFVHEHTFVGGIVDEIQHIRGWWINLYLLDILSMNLRLLEVFQ